MSKKTRSKTGKRIVSIISVIFFLFAISLLIFATLSLNNDNMTLFGCRFYYVLTGSMEPDIAEGSFIVVKQTKAEELSVGDVISFYSDDPDIEGKINTHAIYSIEQDENGKEYFVTRGSANPAPDDYPVYAEDIRGKVVWDSLAAGKIFKVLSNRTVSFCLTVLPIAIIVLINLIDLFVIINTPEKKEGEGEASPKE